MKSVPEGILYHPRYGCFIAIPFLFALFPFTTVARVLETNSSIQSKLISTVNDINKNSNFEFVPDAATLDATTLNIYETMEEWDRFYETKFSERKEKDTADKFIGIDLSSFSKLNFKFNFEISKENLAFIADKLVSEYPKLATCLLKQSEKSKITTAVCVRPLYSLKYIERGTFGSRLILSVGIC